MKRRYDEKLLLKSFGLTLTEFVYFLNNVRKKGSGGVHYENMEELHFQTIAHPVPTIDQGFRFIDATTGFIRL